MNLIRNASVLIIALSMANPLQANDRQVVKNDGISQFVHSQSIAYEAPSSGIETAFSPNESAERLVIKTINSARRSIRLAAYSFTSPAIVHALVTAHKQGIDVRIVVDEKGNKSKASIAALNLVANAGIPVRTNAMYAIHHDKYIIADDRSVQTGSFNYSRAAQQSNSENVLVVWNNASVAASYMRHWTSRFDEATPYQSSY
jgi:phosphatidylserine/phosphatidylglycerophosphate/cardiolipin synthase-like enzyme